MKILAVLVVILLIVLALWAQFDAPCEWFKYTAGKDIPGRCLMD